MMNIASVVPQPGTKANCISSILSMEVVAKFFISPASTNLKGGYTGITLSVCPSVDRIMSALYLQQYSSDPFYICTSYQAKFEILVNFFNL